MSSRWWCRRAGRLHRRASQEHPASNANSRLTSLFGALKAGNATAKPGGPVASSGLTAQGQSTTNSSLVTTFGAEVVDVLPNGMLVVQATRQLTFSQQTQLIKLRVVARKT